MNEKIGNGQSVEADGQELGIVDVVLSVFEVDEGLVDMDKVFPETKLEELGIKDDVLSEFEEKIDNLVGGIKIGEYINASMRLDEVENAVTTAIAECVKMVKEKLG